MDSIMEQELMPDSGILTKTDWDKKAEELLGQIVRSDTYEEQWVDLNAEITISDALREAYYAGLAWGNKSER